MVTLRMAKFCSRWN